MIDTPEPNNDADQSSYDLEGSGAIPLAQCDIQLQKILDPT